MISCIYKIWFSRFNLTFYPSLCELAFPISCRSTLSDFCTRAALLASSYSSSTSISRTA